MNFATALDIVSSIAQYRERRELVPALVDAMRAMIRADGYAVAIRSRREGDGFDVYSEPAAAELPTRLGELVVPDVLEAPRIVRHESWHWHGVRSSLQIPLTVETALIGTLSLWSRNPHAFDAIDLEIANALGMSVGVVIERCLGYEQLGPPRDNTPISLQGLVGHSPAFAAVRRQIEVVAPTDATVLLTGESGTGKDVIARAIHAANGRRDRPLVTINCAAIPASLAETELFGHEEGAFTGATKSRAGRFELADGGTLFLDEIGELPLGVQAKLLRVIQERELERVGGSAPIKIDVRIIAATNRDLHELIEADLFREDLYFRLAVFPIHLPPLRARLEDLQELVEHFVALTAERFRLPPRRVTPEMIRRLAEHDWPGNVRELQNTVERAMIISPGGELSLDTILPRRSTAVSDDDPLRHEYLAALDATSWVIDGADGAAAQLGMHPSTLRHRLKRLGIVRPLSR